MVDRYRRFACHRQRYFNHSLSVLALPVNGLGYQAPQKHIGARLDFGSFATKNEQIKRGCNGSFGFT